MPVAGQCRNIGAGIEFWLLDAGAGKHDLLLKRRGMGLPEGPVLCPDAFGVDDPQHSLSGGGMRGVLANRLRTAETPDLAAQGQSVSRKTGAEVPLTMAILRRRRRLWRGDRRRRSGHLREGGLEHKDLLAQVQDPANGWQLYWVDVAHASYVYQPGTGIFSSFETPTTIALKSEWAAVMGLGGISSGTSPTTPSNPPRASSRRPTTHGCSTRIWPRSASGRA